MSLGYETTNKDLLNFKSMKYPSCEVAREKKILLSFEDFEIKLTNKFSTIYYYSFLLMNLGHKTNEKDSLHLKSLKCPSFEAATGKKNPFILRRFYSEFNQ